MKLFTNGTIHTMNPDHPQVEAVLVNDTGKIEAVGLKSCPCPPKLKPTFYA